MTVDHNEAPKGYIAAPNAEEHCLGCYLWSPDSKDRCRLPFDFHCLGVAREDRTSVKFVRAPDFPLA